MNQLNSLIIEGNVVNDVEVIEPKVGFKVARITIASQHFYKNKSNEEMTETSFFDIEAYGRMGEFAAQKATKGREIRVVGRLKQSTWTDEENRRHSKVFIIAEHIEYKPFRKETKEDK